MTIKNKRIHNTGRLTDSSKRSFGIFTGLALAISAAILIFSGCDISNDTVTNADMAAVNAAISKLDHTSIIFEDTEDQNTVRSDFTLPLSGERGTAISWESSNTDMLSIDQATAAPGALKTEEASIEITLTATVSKGSAKQSKTFSITILANNNETPGIPTGLSINSWAADSLELEWTEALPGRVNGKAGTIIGYTVYYSTSDDFLDLMELKSANQSIDFGSSTRAEVTGLDSGTQYYFAVTAINAYKEGPVSPSLETHTDTPADFVAEAPAIIGRSAGNGQVELTWTAPAATGWKEGQAIVVSGYNIYQDSNPITDITDTAGLTAVLTGIEPEVRAWTVRGLNNGEAYYFALSALTGEGVESLPGGGDVPVTPNESISTIRDVLSLSVEDFAALTDTSGQAISVDITASGLTYSTDYIISISKAGSSAEALVYNPETQEIDLADTIDPVDAGSYTIRASGMGLYNEAVTDDFELTVKLSNTSLLEQALKALSYTDIKFAANEDENSVHSDFTVPLTGLHGSSIAWESDNPAVAISGNAAAVDPPDENTVVTLTAELSLNEENASKEFIIVLTHPPNTLPGAPENIAFTSWNTEAISLSWSAENTGYVDGSKASISAYTVYYSETGDFSDLAALKTAEQYVKISAAANSEAETTAIVSGLRSGVLYYFALSAANSNGEGPLSSSVETHTNSSPGAPVVIGRSAAEQAVVLTWAAPAITGWTDGHEGIISSYDIYQAESAISDLSGLDVLETVNNVNPAGLQSYTATGLDNGRDYYFAVAAVTASGRSLPGGGDLSARPGTTTDLDTVITLSVEDAAASSNTPDQSIAVSLVDGGLSYGQDYAIAIIKGGRATTALSWDAAEKTIKVSPTLSETDDGAYSIIASGMGAYGGNVSDPFTLTVNLSDTDAVAAVQTALDISTEAGGDLNAVTISHIALPIDGPYDTAINWESSDEKVIMADGTVFIPAVGSQDAEVTLTATISKNTANAQKVFTLIVKAQKSTGLSTVPDAIGSIVLSDWSENSVRLDWPEVHPGFIDGNHASINAYTVYYNTSGDFSDLETLANRTVDAGTELYAVPGGLESGKLYYFAVTASNTVGEGPVSQSVSTRTNSLPDQPLITGRIPGNEEIQLNWLAPASAGWKDGAQASIVEYRIYQNDQVIDNVDQLSPVGSVSDMHYTVRSLNNDQTYYFAVTAVNGHGEESFPAGGEAALSPTNSTPGSIKDDTNFSLSVEDAAAWTNTAGQTIDIDLSEDNLIYGQDYSIVISKAGSEASELYYDSGIGKIRVSDALAASLVGDTTYTVTAHGMGGYKDSLTDDFVLTVSLSDADAVAADRRILDISQEAGGNLNAVSIEHISLPANGPNGSTITWSSNNPAVIADDGAVARPLIGTADAVVELTASIRKNSASAARKFTLRVLALRGIANTAPGAPEDLQATPGELKVTLTWIAPDDRGSVWGQSASSLTYSVSGHETLDTAETIPGMGGIRGTVVEVDNLKANTEYSFYVRASNSGTRSAPATIDATVLDISDQMEISAVSYTLSTLEPMAGQTIETISPKLTPDTVKPDDPRLSFAISPTDFEAQTGLDFDENTGRISGTASLTAMSNALDYTITVLPDTGYYKGTPTAAMNIKVIPVLTATWNAITATAFTPGLFGPPSLDSTEWTGSFSAASLPDGLDINPKTGEISGAPNGIYAADDYQIELTGRDNYFGVNSSAMINIRVNPKDLGDTGFFITDLSHTVVALTEDSAALSIDKAGLTHTDDYTLSIAKGGSAVATLSIDNDGKISIGAGITVSDGGDYTITATGQNDYSGTVTGTFTLTVNSRTLTSAMLGSISNPSADFEIQAGFANAETRTLNFDGSLTIDDDYTLAITGRPPDAKPDHLSLDAATAVLTLSTDIVPDDSGEYTLTVSAAGNYTDPVTPLTATFMLTVTKADILSITYNPVTAVFKTAMAQSADPMIEPADAAAGASFTISPDLNADTGLSFDPATGAISGTPTIRASGDYSVSIEGGDGTKYEGSTLTSASFSVSIDPKPIEGTLSYDGSSIATTYGTAQALSIQWTGDLPEQTVTYAIAPKNSADPALPDDILFTPGTGALSVSGTTAVHTGTYTVTASGSGDYTETKEVQISITVDPKELIQSDLGAISNSPFVVSTGSGSPFVETLRFDGPRELGSDYSISITSYPDNAVQSRVSLTSTGELTIESGVLLSEAGEYTVTATGTGNYTGTATAAFTLDVQAVPLTSLSYGGQPLTAVYNTAISPLTATVEPADAADKVDFSIDSSFRGDTGLSFDTDSGRISGTPNKWLTRKSYTVTITGKTGTIYEGKTEDVSIQVSVAQKDIAVTAFAMTFDDKSDANEGTAASHSAASITTDGLIAAADYELTIAKSDGTTVPAVTIANDGSISISSGIDKDNTGEYRVTATGINNYTGKIEAAFTLTVRRKITGISFTPSTLSLIPTQTMTDLAPTLKAGTETQPDDDYIAYTISPDLNADTGLTFNTATGTISGTAATASATQTYTITVVPDPGHYTSTATATIDIEVTEALSASYSRIDGTVNTPISRSGPTLNNPNWDGTFSATLPDGLKINTDNGEITGAPTRIAAAAADYDVSLTGTGSYLGVDATATVTITVNPKLITSVTYAEVHAAVTVEITPSAPTVLPAGAKVTYILDPSETLPGGLNVNPDNGAIEGTPEAGTNQGLTPYTILVSGTGDWLGSTALATVNIQIDTAPAISASYDELIITIRDSVDTGYASMSDGEAATFALTDGESLPEGLTLESDGRITGTATRITGIKTYNIVLTGTGTSAGRSGTATVVISVKPKAITGVSYDDISAVYDTAITALMPKTKIPADLTGTYSSSDLPAGLTISDSTTGEISGTPTALQTTTTESTISIIGNGDWEGSSYDAAVKITIGPKALETADFSVQDTVTVTALTANEIPGVVTSSLSASTDYTLAITAWPGTANDDIVRIDNDGKISTTDLISIAANGSYTVTAGGIGNYSGTAAANFILAVNPKDLTSALLGSINNPSADFTISSGITNDHIKTLSFGTSLTIDEDYTLAIKTRPTDATAEHVSLTGAGILTVTTDVVPDDSGTYTLSATGKDNYRGTETVSFTLSILPLDIPSITYSPVTAVYDTAAAAGPTVVPSDAADKVIYSSSSDLNNDTGLNLDPDTGEISGTPTEILPGGKTYTISITGKNGTKYDGATATTTVNVTVEKRNIEGTLSYSHIVTTYGTEKAANPQWTGELTDQTLSYAITPVPAQNSGVTFVDGTGALSVSSQAAVSVSGTYKITAIGTGNYMGTKTFNVNVTVNPNALETADFSVQNDIKVTALTASTVSDVVTSTSLTAGTDYTLAITSRPNTPNAAAVSIDNDGKVSTTAAISIAADGIYTVRAKGTGNYTGELTHSFTLTVSSIPLTSDLLGSISNPQSDFTVAIGLTYNVYRTLRFNNSLTIGRDFSLAITGRPHGAVGSHVSLNSNTGELTITNNVVTDDSGTYTLRATGKGNYSGTVAASFEMTFKTGISGALSYADLEIAAGQTKRSNASWNNAASGQTVRYTLVSPPAGISIDENNGVVTVDAAVVTADTSCSIRVEGIGNYTGEITADLKVFIRDWMAPDLTLAYTDIRVYKGSSASSSPQWSSVGPTAVYGIAPLSGGTLPDEIRIDPSSGDISVSSSAALQADTLYQVTATATGSWKGWKKAEIRISVYDTFHYEFKPALVGQEFTLPAINAASFGQFAVNPSLPTGLDINRDSGEISGTPTTRQLATEYTITASPTGGGSAISNKVYLFIQEQAVDKDDLWRMIDEEIVTQGNTADLGIIDTSIITDMSHLFNSYSWDISNNLANADYSAFNGDISGWDVSSVTDMSLMFYRAAAFNGDISGWDVSSVTNMDSIFWDTESFNGDLSGWDVSKVTNMDGMFTSATNFNGDLSGWDVSSVTSMSGMFDRAAAFNGDISGWDVSSVTGMSSMFSSATNFNGDLSGWDVSSVISISFMFSGAAAFNGDISGWDVSKITNMEYMFTSATNFNGDLSGWDVSSVTGMWRMFNGAAAFNGDISGWDVSSVTTMGWMFREAAAFNGDITGWDVSSVTDMRSMFYNAEAFNGDLSGWNVSSVTNMLDMFSGSGLANNPPSWYSP